MADFITAAFQASQTLGGPHRLARRLGVQPDQLYRWIAGLDLPAEGLRVDLQRRIDGALLVSPAAGVARRRHGDRQLAS
jgi:DNA-binding transcriptional regulator YdaS (Cro superfamily)